jgi:hypothetical protein
MSTTTLYTPSLSTLKKLNQQKGKTTMRLFRPAWDSDNEEEALEAVAKIRDEARLARVAKKTRCYKARKAAMERVTNQSLLADIIKNVKECCDIHIAALKRVTGQRLLADIALYGRIGYLCLSAAARVTNPGQHEHIAKEARHWLARMAAVTRVTNQRLLADIARKDKNSYVRKVAAHQLVNYDLTEDA